MPRLDPHKQARAELSAAQKDVHRAVKTLHGGAQALADALTTLVLIMDQAVERFDSLVARMPPPNASPATKPSKSRR